jgi:hypothetical protein
MVVERRPGPRVRVFGCCLPIPLGMGLLAMVGLPGLEPGTSSLSGFCPRACFRRIAPAACADDLPLETVTRLLCAVNWWVAGQRVQRLSRGADPS